MSGIQDLACSIQLTSGRADGGGLGVWTPEWRGMTLAPPPSRYARHDRRSRPGRPRQWQDPYAAARSPAGARRSPARAVEAPHREWLAVRWPSAAQGAREAGLEIEHVGPRRPDSDAPHLRVRRKLVDPRLALLIAEVSLG